jgi:hypothetical protein
MVEVDSVMEEVKIGGGGWHRAAAAASPLLRARRPWTRPPQLARFSTLTPGLRILLLLPRHSPPSSSFSHARLRRMPSRISPP